MAKQRNGFLNMHLFKGSGESCVHEPQKGTITSPHRAEPALQDSGVSGGAGLGRPNPGNSPALTVQSAPCGHFPELLQEEAMYIFQLFLH